MTYQIGTINIKNIKSPVRVKEPTGEISEYKDGAEVCEHKFDKAYRVGEIRTVDGVVEIRLVEIDRIDTEENLFDGD